MSPEVRRLWLLAAVLLGLGAWLRFEAAAAFKPAGTDEYLYSAYVKFLAKNGLSAYPDLVEQYLIGQQRQTAVLPPKRSRAVDASRSSRGVCHHH